MDGVSRMSFAQFGLFMIIFLVSESMATVVPITSEQQFQQEVLAGSRPAIVQFAAKWCGACTAATPQFETFSHDPEWKDTLLCAYVDVDKLGALAARHSVKGVPTFIYFKNGEVQDKSEGFSGATFTADLRTKANQHFAQTTHRPPVSQAKAVHTVAAAEKNNTWKDRLVAYVKPFSHHAKDLTSLIISGVGMFFRT